jgi:hypothetical protein
MRCVVNDTAIMIPQALPKSCWSCASTSQLGGGGGGGVLLKNGMDAIS